MSWEKARWARTWPSRRSRTSLSRINHSPSRPAPGLKYPVIEQRPSLEGKVERSQSANYVEKRDRFVKEYSTESSMMRE